MRTCALCGKEISGGIPVMEAGLTPDLDAYYHGKCFEKKERRLSQRKPLIHSRLDSKAESEYGTGD